MALREAGPLQRLPAPSTMVIAESPSSRVSHITLDRKRAGKPIAGNRHDGFEVAGAGTQLTVRLVRHSQRKRGAQIDRTYGVWRLPSTQPSAIGEGLTNPSSASLDLLSAKLMRRESVMRKVSNCYSKLAE